jgi:alpha-methylacyl-CoA racemase
MLKLLEGVKVLDLTRLLPGPVCTWYLAELGAEVTKIEPPEGDYVRHIPPLAKKNSYVFLQLNFNKTCLTLDLKQDSDLQILKDKVKDAQVFVESFRPGVAKSLGIDFESLKKINPTLVYCSITGYGQTGPYRDFPGHDLNYLAYSGILEQIGNRGAPPALSNFQIADLSGGSLSACVGILAALLSAQKKKTAHHLDISMLDCVMGLNQIALATYQAGMKDVPRGADLLAGGFPFYSIYEVKDGRYGALGALEKKFWKNFCEAVGKGDWISWYGQSPEKFADFRREIGELFKTKMLPEWEALLGDKECCFSPILKISETFKNPQVVARNVYRTHHSEEDGDFLVMDFPIKVDPSV